MGSIKLEKKYPLNCFIVIITAFEYAREMIHDFMCEIFLQEIQVHFCQKIQSKKKLKKHRISHLRFPECVTGFASTKRPSIRLALSIHAGLYELRYASISRPKWNIEIWYIGSVHLFNGHKFKR